jgi:restriction system protein
MAKIPKDRRGKILHTVFAVLVDNPDGIKAGEAIKQVEQRLELTDFEKSYYPHRPNVRRFEKIVRFLTIPAVKAGWM